MEKIDAPEWLGPDLHPIEQDFEIAVRHTITAQLTSNHVKNFLRRNGSKLLCRPV